MRRTPAGSLSKLVATILIREWGASQHTTLLYMESLQYETCGGPSSAAIRKEQQLVPTLIKQFYMLLHIWEGEMHDYFFLKISVS